MRRSFLRVLPVLLVLGVAVPAIADIARSFSVTTTSTSPFSGTAPTTTTCAQARTGTDATGLRLDECKAYYVCVVAAAAQTLSGGGTISAYFEDPIEAANAGAGAWARNDGADETIGSAASGKLRYCFPQRKVEQGTPGCGFWAPSGVTTSGGTTVTVFARCIK